MLRNGCGKSALVLSALTSMFIAQRASAQAPLGINFGDTVYETLECTEIQHYTFNANAGERIVAHVTECADYGGVCRNACFCFDQRLTLSSNGQVLSENVSRFGNNSPRTLDRTEIGEVMVPTSGPMELELVDRDDNGRGEYSVFVQNVSNPGQAEAIALNETLARTLTTCGEVDTFTFEGGAGQLVNIEMTPQLNSQVVPIVVLFGPDGGLVQRPLSGLLTAELFKSGRHTLLAYSQHSTTGSYQLSVELDDSTPVGRGSGIQLTPDGAKTLINKHVGNQHWAITLDHGNGTVTGNVSIGAGESTTFVFCTETGREGDLVDYLCSGADPCVSSPCTQSSWVTVGEVSLPLSFFEVPE